MKKNLFIATLALAVVLVSASAKAASTPSTSTDSLKIGYVDFNRALNETREGKTAKNTLTSEFKERQQKLDIVQNELKTMKEELDKQRLILSADAMKNKEEKYRDKFLELQQKLGTFKQEMAQKEAALTEGLLKKLKGIVKNIGQQESYTVILEKSQEVVLYSPNADDLTDRIIKICDSSK